MMWLLHRKTTHPRKWHRQKNKWFVFITFYIKRNKKTYRLLAQTFGYHFYQRTRDVAILQQIFGHSVPSVTLHYIGIDDDMIDRTLGDFSL